MKNQIILLFIAISFPLIFISCSKKSEEVHPYTIGQNYGGGIIFYIDASWQHGLICAANDQSAGIWWQLDPSFFTNITEGAIGSGSTNTKRIVALVGPGSYAAKLCDDLELNGYTDWFLPSRDELIAMFTNLSLEVGSFNTYLGAYYWSSTDEGVMDATAIPFTHPFPFSLIKTQDNCLVRAVRAF